MGQAVYRTLFSFQISGSQLHMLFALKNSLVTTVVCLLYIPLTSASLKQIYFGIHRFALWLPQVSSIIFCLAGSSRERCGMIWVTASNSSYTCSVNEHNKEMTVCTFWHELLLLSVQCNVQHWTEYKTTLASVRPSVHPSIRPSVRPSGVRPDGNYGQHCELSFRPIYTKFGM